MNFKIKPVILIHTDSLRREYPANWLLGKKLESLGYKVILTSRASTPWMLRIFTPRIVILSHVFAISGKLLNSLRERGVRIFANEVEGEIEGNEIGISGTYPTDIAYKCFEKIFTWSEWSARWLVKNRNIDLTKVEAVGSIRLSLLKYARPRSGQGSIGILSRFEMINEYDGRHQFENLMSMHTDLVRARAYFERTIVEMESFSITSQIIDRIVKLGIPVIIRPHPNESVDNYALLVEKYGPLLQIDTSTDYVQWLEKLSVIIGTLSSAYTEPYLLKIPIISTVNLQKNNYTSNHLSPFVETFSRACHKPNTIESLIDLCCDKSLLPINDSQFYNDLAAIYCLDDKIDPIEKLSAFIGLSSPDSGKLIDFFMPSLKFFLDLAIIVSCTWRKNPKRAFRTHVIYNYNCILHRMSFFMKKIDVS